MKATFTSWNDADYLEGRAIKKSPVDSFREEPACRVGEYITDIGGYPYQMFFYSSFGEALVAQHANSGDYEIERMRDSPAPLTLDASAGQIEQNARFANTNKIKPVGWQTPYRFNGKEIDPETGLAYYGARFYEPKTSIWLSVDPLASQGHNIALSPYHFSSNNPVMRVDPDGRTDWEFNKKTGRIKEVEGTKDDGPDRILIRRKWFWIWTRSPKIHQLNGKIDNYDDYAHTVKDGDNIYEKIYQTYTTSDVSDAEELYDFFVNNTEIEIGHEKMKVDGKLVHRFGTSGDPGQVSGDLDFYRNEIKNGKNIEMLEMEHNHGNHGGKIGSFGPSPEDIEHVKDARRLFNDTERKIKFYINKHGNRGKSYDENTPPTISQ